MACPWAKIKLPEPVNFQEVLSEELARDLQAKEEKKYIESISSSVPRPADDSLEIPQEILDAAAAGGSVDGDRCTSSDSMIAKLLQSQYDKLYDEELKRTEQKFNGSSKVSVSFDNYRRTPQNFDFESDLEEDEIVDIIDRKDWDRFDVVKRQSDSIPPCGYKVENGVMVTKHDITMDGRKNACKLMSFPPEFPTGDSGQFDLKISNKVFNKLKRWAQIDDAKRYRVKDKKEDHATTEFGLDTHTMLLLQKWINRELLNVVNGVISIGKEAVILHAESNPNWEDGPPPPECAIKVFKTTLLEFKQRDKYIKEDSRFKERIGKQTARKTVHLWAEKEMYNLKRLRNAGIPCPEVVKLKEHVLLMSFIGENRIPAPKLKHANLSRAEWIIAYEQVTSAMKTLFQKANLIHADLSEYNILWHDDQCYFIDVSQAVMPDNENSFFFLMRDCQHIHNFFFKKGVPKVESPEELFESITGLPYEDKIKLSELRESFKLKPHLVDKPGVETSFNFEEAWNRSMNESISTNMEAAALVESPRA